MISFTSFYLSMLEGELRVDHYMELKVNKPDSRYVQIQNTKL